MKANFEKSLKFVLQFEGGFSDRKDDPGGRTNFGITQRTYSAWRQRRALSIKDVKGITQDEVRQIYRGAYWDAIGADDLPGGVDCVSFDFAVNSGVARAKKYLAIYNTPGAYPDQVINSFCQARLAFLKGLKTWPTFGKGWGRRVAAVNRLGLSLAREFPDAPPSPLESPGQGAPVISDQFIPTVIVAVLGALQLVDWGVIINNPRAGALIVAGAVFNAIRLSAFPIWARILIPAWGGK